jgi:lysophospholipase L1-like esterase
LSLATSRRPIAPVAPSDRPGQRRRRLYAARAAIAALSLLAPLLLLELLLRLAGPILPGDYQTAAFTAASDVVGRRNKPNTAGWKQTMEFTTWVQVNSKGLRGPEIEDAKPPGTFRVLALGDSFTFALQVNEEQTFLARLPDELRARGADRPIETINAGTDGWSTANEYEWLVTEGYRYEPDVVLLMFYVGNDPGDNADQVGSPDAVDRLHFGADRGGPLDAARDLLRRSSVAYNVFEQGVLLKLGGQPDDDELDTNQKLDERQRLAATRAFLGTDVDQPFWGYDSPRKIRGWAVTEALLGRLRDFCAARGIALVVVEIPTGGQVIYREPTSTPLPTLAQRVGLPLVDLLGPFRAQSKSLRERLYFQQNGHWTADGHRLVARVIADALGRFDLVPGR